jgi:uncharacterized protein YfaS (alpha-2-macroglobulin family)
VPGGKTPPTRNLEQEKVEIIPSKKEFAPGDVAELLVVAPFTPAEGILTLRRDGIVKTERFTMKDSSTVLRIPLEERYLPNIHAQVDLVGAAIRTGDTLVPMDAASTSKKNFAGGTADEDKNVLAPRPAFASGNINLAISTAGRKLSVSADARDKTLIPSGSTRIDIAVKDHKGEPVADSEVAIVVVDESVLALSRYSIADPMSTFYTERGMGVTDYHSRKDVLLGNPDDVKPPPPVVRDRQEAESQAGASVDVTESRIALLPKGSNFSSLLKVAPGTARGDAATGDQNSAIALRENFNALAL